MSLNVLTQGQGSPLLLLHGFTGSAGSWWLQLDHWTARHRVIAPDLLGHGRSDAPADPERYALEAQAAQLADLLDVLEAAPAAVIGYSMGARLALVLALRHPGRVGRLVLESPSPGIADGVARAQRRAADEALAAEIERDGIEAFVAGWEVLPLFVTHAGLPPEVRLRLRQERLSQDPVGLAASLRGAGQGRMQPLHHDLTEIAVPALVLAGAHDETGVARAHLIADAMPQATLQVIADAGHTPHLEQPHRYLDAIDPFLPATDDPNPPPRKDA
jgi:2-succinyl-6-hydroxy-2,4-cyclohexadiene-1-carboxylate synthase